MKRKQRSPAGPRRRNWDTEEQQRVERLQRVAACTRRSSLMASSAYSRRVMDSRRRSAAIEGRVTDEERAVALVEAAAIDDIAAMEQIADAGARIDVADPGGRYAVHVAAASGKLAAIGWLVQHAAEANRQWHARRARPARQLVTVEGGVRSVVHTNGGDDASGVQERDDKKLRVVVAHP